MIVLALTALLTGLDKPDRMPKLTVHHNGDEIAIKSKHRIVDVDITDWHESYHYKTEHDVHRNLFVIRSYSTEPETKLAKVKIEIAKGVQLVVCVKLHFEAAE